MFTQGCGRGGEVGYSVFWFVVSWWRYVSSRMTKKRCEFETDKKAIDLVLPNYNMDHVP